MPPRLLSLCPCWLLPLLCLLGNCQQQSVNSGVPEAEFIPQRLENDLPFATTQSKLFVFDEPGESALADVEEGSSIRFVGSRAMGKEQEGRFTRFSGSFQLEEGRLVGEDNRITIDVTSLETDHPRLTEFLLSKAFFGAEKHPTAEFTITGLQTMLQNRSLIEGNSASHLLEGNLSLAGKRHGIRIPVLITETEEDQVLLQSRFTLNRLDWGLNNPGQVGDDVINDLVLMKFVILGKTQ